MKSKTVALLLSNIGVTKTQSQPHVSDDNLFFKAQFKTLNDGPGFPEWFGWLQDAKAWCPDFFDWCNNVHYGRTGYNVQRRLRALGRFRREHPARYVNAPKVITGSSVEVRLYPPAEIQV